MRLNPQEAADGEFRVHLSLRQPIAAGSLVIRLPRPLNVTQIGGRLIVLAGRDLAVELADEATAERFTPLEPEPVIEDPNRPALPNLVLAPVLWLGYDGGADRLPLRITPRSRVLQHETRLKVRIDRAGVDCWQTLVCRVRNGTLKSFEMVVPTSWEGRWELAKPAGEPSAARIIACDRVAVEAPDGVRYRITLDRETLDRVSLAFHVRQEPKGWGRSASPDRVEMSWMRLPEGEALPTRIEVSADPSVQLQPVGKEWTEPPNLGVVAPKGTEEPIRLVWLGADHPAPWPALQATVEALVRLPVAVVSRLWLRTIELPDGGRQNSAWMNVRSDLGSLQFALPPGATLAQVHVESDEARADRLGDGSSYRLALPGSAQEPQLVQMDFTVPAAAVPAIWTPLRVLDGVAVQESFWEVRIPWNRTLVGGERGWSDANRWRWETYLWTRRPALDERDLTAWVLGTKPVAGTAEPVADRADADYHGYLFHRAGDPVPTRLVIWPRWALVGVCSGVVLAAGMILLLARPAGRSIWVVGFGLALTLAIALDPNTGLQLGESAALGLLLALVAALTQRFVERRRGTAAAFSERSGVVVAPPSSPSRQVVLEVGSDESTVIRRAARRARTGSGSGSRRRCAAELSEDCFRSRPHGLGPIKSGGCHGFRSGNPCPGRSGTGSEGGTRGTRPCRPHAPVSWRPCPQRGLARGSFLRAAGSRGRGAVARRAGPGAGGVAREGLSQRHRTAAPARARVQRPGPGGAGGPGQPRAESAAAPGAMPPSMPPGTTASW